jgi:EAL domain-containing protein (putative c-di-GMP-specific phosphodiesterase class I)
MGMTRRISPAVRPGARYSDPAPMVRTIRNDVSIELQPIIAVPTGAVFAVEALARFADGADSEVAFRVARKGGVGPELEARCLRAALRRRADLPEGVLLSVNVSPEALPFMAEQRVWDDDLRGVIVEITEQEVSRPAYVSAELDQLRNRGAAIAIDDVSTGYAGLLRLAEMAPDYVKVDRRVVTGVADELVQAAVLEALVTLSHRLGAAVIGEGVESLADLAALGQYDVDYAQGFAIARPSAEHVPVSGEIVATCRANRRRVLGGDGTAAREVARTRDVYAVTAALASADRRHDVDTAIAAAAIDLGVDLIGVSILTSGARLREIASTGPLDPTVYVLRDYPATLAAMTGPRTIEVQLSDPGADAAERALMLRLGYQSLLLVPVIEGERTIGVVEFAHRTPRRWTAQDIAHARGLAGHLSPVLRRLGVGATPVASLSERRQRSNAV